jgi:hypothetical protein
VVAETVTSTKSTIRAQPDQMRRGQADERDGSRHGDRRTREQHHRETAEQPDPRHRQAQRPGRIVGQGQGVERGSDGERENQTDDERRQHRPEHVEGTSGRRTGQPEAGLVQRPLAGEHDGRGPGHENELEHGAAERGPYRVQVTGAPGEGLGDGPGDSERGAYRQTDDGTRQPEAGDHDGVSAVAVAE